MKTSKNIAEALNNYLTLIHVVSSSEVHSFETLLEAEEYYKEAALAEEKIGSGFTVEIIEEI